MTLQNHDVHTKYSSTKLICVLSVYKRLSPLTPITLKRMDGSNLGTYFQNFRPVAYPKNEYGKFYSGDSYVLLFVSVYLLYLLCPMNVGQCYLQTKENRGVKSWNIHFWLGQQTSQVTTKYFFENSEDMRCLLLFHPPRMNQERLQSWQ